MLPTRLSQRFILVVAAALLMLAAAGGAALARMPGDGLLKVTDAFRLSADAGTPGRIKLHWRIADHYYLYRGRIHVKVLGDNIKAGKLDLPAGEKEHDPYLGDVEIYHHELTATLPYTVLDAGADAMQVAVTFQGCHEVDPKICYPPHTQKLTLPMPTATDVGQTLPPRGTDPTVNLLPTGSAQGIGAEPLPPEQAFRFSAIVASPDQLLLRWVMPKGYYLYRDKTTLKLVDSRGVTLGAPQWPAGVAHHDAYFGSAIVYYGEVDVPLPIERASGSDGKLTLEASFQGCMDHGICYPVMTRKVSLALPGGAAGGAPAATASAATSTVTPPDNTNAAPQSAVQKLAGSLGGNGRWLALLGFFGAGLLLAFTPCVLPMIPILSGLIAGAGQKLSAARAFVLSLVYVLASSVVFVIAGVIAGLIGASVQAAFQSPWLLGAFALVFVLLALSMFGFYELRPPAALQRRITAASNQQKGGSLIGVAVMGVLSALIVGPCVAPPLAGAVLYIAQSHDPAFGALALFLLSLGMGVPLIVFGMAAGRWLPHTGPWMKTVQAVFGVVFLALAIWMLSRFLDAVWIMLMSGALLVGSAVYMGAFDRMTPEMSGWRRLWKALGLVLLVFGLAELVGVTAGSRNLLAPLSGLRGGASTTTQAPGFQRVKTVADLKQAVAAASAAGKPVMLDFYADWCVSCKEMEHFTYSQPKVQAAMSRFVLLKADVTANDADDRALLKHFGLFGPPATIFYDTDGKELTGLRLIGFEKADAFLARLDKARQD
ncbi:MAG TPA: protein-disulfide reductase DsbD [Rhodanobacteraceae bacterium]|nr:protein-disulfide reductase DsbD [Rhodanobacteraceae bacterium]